MMKFFGTGFKKHKKNTTAPISSIEQLDLQNLPILNADQLIKILGQQSRIRNIRSLTALDLEQFNQLYMPAINAFCERAQLVPASESYHHTQPGGLIIHTLSVIENALLERSRYILPLFSDPEEQAAQRHVWTYAVFAGALLHDVGKLITQQSIRLNNNAIYTAYGASILDSDADTYQIRFTPNTHNWRLHRQLAISFFYLLPNAARNWLGQYTNILSELSAWLAGDQEHWDSIGNIVRQADSRSVADSLGLYNSTRFPGATAPLSEKLMTAIRQILPSLGINKPGAAIFKQGPKTWIMSKTLADTVRSHLAAHNETSIPTDNNRIFDELSQHHFLITDPISQKAIHLITVTSKDGAFQQRFSVLCFETRRLYHATNEPNDWTGTITHSGTTHPENHIAVTTESSQLNETGTAYLSPQNDEIGTNYLSEAGTTYLIKNDETGADSYCKTDETGTTSIEVSQSQLPDAPTGLSDPDLGKIFMEWLKHCIDTRIYVINANDSPLHLLEDGLGIMSPTIFINFCKTYDLTTDNPDSPGYLKVQNAVSKLKRNVKFGKKDVIFYTIKNKSTRLCFYVMHSNDLINNNIFEGLKINETLCKIKFTERII